jgi:hypothetical protein
MFFIAARQSQGTSGSGVELELGRYRHHGFLVLHDKISAAMHVSFESKSQTYFHQDIYGRWSIIIIAYDSEASAAFLHQRDMTTC